MRGDDGRRLLADALDGAARFCLQLDETGMDDQLRAQARTQHSILTNLAAVLDFMSSNGGQEPAPVAAHEREIRRQPQSAEDVFSCTPLFIIGSRRSGTTLLAQMMNAGDAIHALPENWLAGTLASCDPLIAIGHVLRTQLREPFTRYLRRLALLCDGLYAELARNAGKTRWVSKELFVPHRLDLLDAMFDYRARYVYAVRHGFDVAASCCARFPARDGFPLNPSTSLSVEGYLREWIANNESTASFHDRNPERCLVVRYEELVECPEQQGRRLFAFLGEPWPEDLPGRLRERPFGPGMGDDRIYGMGGRIEPRPSPWRDWPEPLLGVLGRLADPTLLRLGYEPVAARA